jgi:2-keto-4-pentenoate hydratase/2-oxohepta-3-ene-1,7-dioic acid hydratase in catechol pathway
MKFVRFNLNSHPTYGLVEGRMIVPLEGTPFDSWVRRDISIPLDGAKILVPVIPPNFYAVGLNYPDHVRHRAQTLGVEPVFPARPEPGYRSNNALIAHEEDIVLPPDSTGIQYEGELVVVIGKKAKNVTESEALTCVLGYTIGNDISERNWQKIDRTFWRSKNSDTFKPMGPWIETDVDLDSLRTTVRVNGKTKITFATNDMIFGIANYIAAMSRYITLYPGDVIWMGTEGVAEDLRVGDTVEVEISSIGTLKNTVVEREG